MASGLPLTLLELHTIMHVCCALAIYGLWWYKPVDIRYPVVLNLEEELAAKIYFSFVHKPPNRRNTIYPSQDNPAPNVQLQYPTTLVDNRFLRRVHRVWERYHYSGRFFYHIRFCLVEFHKSFRLSAGTGIRTMFRRSDSPFKLDLHDVGLGEVALSPLCVRAQMIMSKGSVRSGRNIKNHSLVSLVAFSLVYGSAHAAAWNAHFPTPTELLLWKVSSVALAAGIPLGFGIYLCGTKYDNVIKRINNLVSRYKRMEWVFYKCNKFIGSAFVLFLFSLVLFVVLARLFLVVESFISLRSLPKGSYDVVPWTNYWPHF